MTYHPPAGKTWSDLQAQGQDNDSDTASCEICGVALYGWEADRARRYCGYCEARRNDDGKRSC